MSILKILFCILVANYYVWSVLILRFIMGGKKSPLIISLEVSLFGVMA